MAFRTSDVGIGVVDDDRGITIKMAFGRFDDTGWVPYSYIEGDLTFIFSVESEEGIPTTGPLSDGTIEPRITTLAMHIIEQTVRYGLIKAIGKTAFENLDLDHIKSAIKEGIYVFAIDEGRHLQLVPEFKVDFR